MARPLVNILVIEKPGCKYPPVRILFDDGTVQDYVHVPKVEYHHPKPIGIFNRQVGYQYDPEYKPRHMKNRRIR